MVLRPILDFQPATDPGFIPAWNAVESRQKLRTGAWWLIAQADHAEVSGAIAAHFATSGFPNVSPEVVRAIARHDIGWDRWERDPQGPPALHPDGRPLSFFEIAPGQFLRAWSESIERAAQDSPVGGYIVSQHFTWLGEFRLGRDEDSPEVRSQVMQFVESERCRQTLLKKDAGYSVAWETLLPLLQFCDILSLFLCSGTRQAVEFPQRFPGGQVRAHFDGDTARLSQSPFPETVKLAVPARRYPGGATTSIHISLG